MTSITLKANSMNLPYLSATELVLALATKQISSSELVAATIARIEMLDHDINAVVVRDFERAIKSAIAADAALARGESLPLLGLPMTVKESFNVMGLATTWGNPIYRDWKPSEDSLVITRLKEAGAIIIGKTNVPFMLQDWQSYNPINGTTNNPYDLNLTAGGSSGGSAAALAAGFVSLELGSDLAGSLRTPAHYCGVFSHKPTADLIPLRGCSPPTVPASPNRVDFVVAGPMARSAKDLSLALSLLAGPDKIMDGKGYRLSLPKSRHEHLKNFRVLVIDTHPLYPTSNLIQKAMDDFVNRLIQLDVIVSRTSPLLPDLGTITRTFASLLWAWGCADVPLEVYERLEASKIALMPDDNSLIACGLRGGTVNHRDWLLTMRTRWQLQQQWRKLYQEYDVVLCPVMPTLAFPHNHSSDENHREIEVNGSKYPYEHQYIWVSIATLFGLPATVIPIDRSKEGLPIGIQIIGDYLEDATTIAFANLVENEFGGFSPPTAFG